MRHHASAPPVMFAVDVCSIAFRCQCVVFIVKLLVEHVETRLFS